MAWAKNVLYFLRPSIMLGLLLCGLIFCGLGLLIWEKSGLPLNLYYFKLSPFVLDRTQGVVLTAAFLAAAGWMITSLVTLRNSVKQHTITTLLQSRLSATYMEHVKAVNAVYTTQHGHLMKLTPEEVKHPPTGVTFGSLTYLLNYLEFVAVGIRHGDLHEKVMKSSLRGIVCSVYCVAEELIKARQAEVSGEQKARVYEHLCWLHERWRNDPQLPPIVARPSSMPLAPITPTPAPQVQL